MGQYRQSTRPCFGAAARDPKLMCASRARTVSPKVGEPDPEQNWQCNPEPAISACVSGVAEGDAGRHVALVGDSHSAHWRATLNFVAGIRGWRIYSHFSGGCFFSAVASRFTEGCGEFYRNVLGWFRQHPEVSTVFITSNADTPVAVAAGETIEAVRTRGFRDAFQALPRTVKRIVVLRDTPRSSPSTLSCAVEASQAATRRLAPLCPLVRTYAIRPDQGVAAVKQLRSARYRSVDLTPFMCSRVYCYPVVGGTLVNADQWGHLNMTFMWTLGPYLLRALDALKIR